MPEIKPEIESLAKIKVIGVGGSGGAAINRMILADIKGVEFIAINTDLQALHYSKAPVKLHIGKQLTKGLGSGMNPDVGRKAAEENINEIREIIKGADMVFITCGLGGGTGSGASPVVAQVAREVGALTVAVVTKPFSFEQSQRQDIAEHAHEELVQHVDTIITINNDRVLDIVDKKTSLLEAFHVVDDVLRQGVQGISEVITTPSLINVDFADVRAIMSDAGSALMGMGRGSGENRAMMAAKSAIASPLLDVSIDGAKGILFMITGGTDLGMHEVNEAAKIITGSAEDGAKVIFGASINDSLKDEVRITVIATGFGEQFVASRAAQKAEIFMNGRNYFGTMQSQQQIPKQTPPRMQPMQPVMQQVEAPVFTPPPPPVVQPRKPIFSQFDTPFKKKEIPVVKREEIVPPPEVVEEQSTDNESKEDEGEDLDIPTFLRRKIK